MEHARSRWVELTNKTMQRLGRDARVDQAISSLEAERQALISQDQKRSEWEWASHGDGHGGGASVTMTNHVRDNGNE